MKNCALLTIGMALSLPLPDAHAAPEEIQVYMDELSHPGESGVDIHNNYVVSGSATPGYPGAQTPNHVFKLTPEFYYGLTDNLELGAYILTSRNSYNNVNLDGEKLRLKYIAPKQPGQSDFFGANIEIGYLNGRLSQNPWGAQLKGIYGYRSERWTFAVNPNIDWSIAGPVAAPATFEIDTKVSYAIKTDFAVGIESYNGLGSVDRSVSPNQQSQNLYVVLDTSALGLDVNFGIGRGFSQVSDKWVAKAIVSVPFGKK